MKHLVLFENHGTLTPRDIILNLVEIFLDEYSDECSCAKHINSGLCPEFEEALQAEFKEAYGEAGEMMHTDYLFGGETQGYGVDDNGEYEEAEFDPNGYQKYGTKPEETPLEAYTSMMVHHVWALFKGKHYDAEAPDGVENFFDLPYFQRVAKAYHKQVTKRPKK